MAAYPWPYVLQDWTRRRPIAAIGNAGAGRYLQITAPQDDELWGDGGMQADGDDLRFTFVDANKNDAVCDHSNDAPNTTTRTIANLLVELSDTSLATATLVCPVWMYWGNSAAANAEGSVTNTTSLTKRFTQTVPDPSRTILCVPEAPGATTPAQRISKKVDEEFDLWWDMTPALGEAPRMSGRSRSRFRIGAIDFHATTGTGVYSASGATREATYTTQDETQFYESPEGRFYVGIRLTPGVGSSGTNYVAKLRGTLTTDNTLGLAEDITFEFRCLVQVQNPV